MGKVKVTKAVANSIEKLREAWGDAADHKMISVAFDDADSWVSETHAELNEMDSMTLVKALTIGYEVVATPEDRLRAIYDSYFNEYMKSDEGSFAEGKYLGYRRGIEEALDILGIEVEGIKQ